MAASPLTPEPANALPAKLPPFDFFAAFGFMARPIQLCRKRRSWAETPAIREALAA